MLETGGYGGYGGFYFGRGVGGRDICREFADLGEL